MTTSQTQKMNFVVVGGGITGAFAAYFLSARGCGVTLIERSGIGNEASSRNPGGINPMHGTGIPGALQPLARQAFDLHLQHWDRIRQLSGRHFLARRIPRVHVAFSDIDLIELETLRATHLDSEGFSARWMDKSELLKLESRLSPNTVRGLWTEGNAKADSHELTKAVAAAAEKQGAIIRIGEVIGVEGANGRVSGVRLDNTTLRCDGVILATGPWVTEFRHWIGCDIPIEPVRGELLFVKVTGSPVQHSYAWRAACIYGTGANELWLGGNEERAGFDTTPTEAARSEILKKTSELMPGMVIDRVINQISGLRPMAPDDLPILGLAPGWSNVCLALGGGRKGMLYGPAMGLASAEFVMNGATTLPVSACLPTRFTGEQLQVN